MKRLVLTCLLALVALAGAHELQPAFLQLREGADRSVAVTWKIPYFKGKPLPIEPGFPDDWEALTEPHLTPLGNGLLFRWKMRPGDGGLDGATIRIDGPRTGRTDVLLRASLANGESTTRVMRPESPAAEISFSSGGVPFMLGYLFIGIQHILLGVDHLLFVLGLLLIVDGTRALVKTITMFTVAHSISLAIATFRIVEVPEAPLNLCIALSILFLGPEVVRKWRGGTSFTIEHPWVVAFAFGLLHGIGFASGLSVTGLPREEIPLALLWFNIGVELGQLAFVLVAIALVRAWKAIDLHWPLALRRAPGLAIGILGAYWTFDRFHAMLTGI